MEDMLPKTVVTLALASTIKRMAARGVSMSSIASLLCLDESQIEEVLATAGGRHWTSRLRPSSETRSGGCRPCQEPHRFLDDFRDIAKWIIPQSGCRRRPVGCS
ncbi:hypothetical protein FHT77_004186 [Rhizobium sp. BK181]|nr:hypothetical protein [Rhizobium sp. BK181]